VNTASSATGLHDSKSNDAPKATTDSQHWPWSIVALEEPDVYWTTLEVAALLIAKLDPRSIRAHMLPRVAPIPHAYLPHEFGLDHDLLADIVWGAVKALKASTEQSIEDTLWKRRGRMLLLVLSAVAGIVVFASLDQRAWSSARIAAVSLLFLLCGVWIFRENALLGPSAVLLEKKMELLSSLRQGRIPNEAFLFQHQHPHHCRPKSQSARLRAGNVPVLVRFELDSEQFPGLGYSIELDTLSACLGEDEDSTGRLGGDEEEKLHTALGEHLRKTFVEHPSCSCQIGNAIVVDANSLIRYDDRLTGAWVDSAGVPYSGIPHSQMLTPSRVRGASQLMRARLYLAVQVYDLDFRVVATAFVRPVVRCGTAFVSMSVALIGPPRDGWAFIDHWLINGTKTLDTMKEKPRARYPKYSSFDGLLELDPMQPHGDPTKGTWGVRKAKKKAEEERRRWDAACTAASMRWRGFFDMPRQSQREMTSVRRSDNVFGQQECQLMTKSLVAGVIRATLECYESLGYDVEKYKGDKGQWSIKIDSIDRMIVGERVSITEQRKASAAEERKVSVIEDRNVSSGEKSHSANAKETQDSKEKPKERQGD
jgi:hypothetical protein